MTDDRIMTATAPAQATNPPAASGGFIAAFVTALFGVAVATLTPVSVTLAIRIKQIDPDNAAAGLSLVLGVAAIVALLSGPFFGQLSDRTTSRWGMRRPWLVGGLAVGLAGLCVLATAASIPVLLVGWCVTQIGFSALNAALAALLIDQVPDFQRGKVSGLVGMCQALGVVTGVFLVQSVGTSIALMFLVPGALAAAAVIVLAAAVRDRRLDPADRGRYDIGAFFRSFWVNPIQHRGFAWAWLGRFLMITGFAILQTYQVYYLSDQLGVETVRIPTLVLQSTLVLTATVVVSSIGCGWLSDRLRRRKAFVLGSAGVYGMAMIVVATAGTFGAFLIGMVIGGLALGAYLAVDLALVAQVLPDGGATAAKDLGVFNIANAVPQLVAPAIAPIFLAIGTGSGGNYTALFIGAAVFSLLGALAIQPIRGVR
ncbi:MFS transporter [Kribbella solani]|uniref:MFS family permease n=1 Tax=Kribbella solani TaxID=236067 RepID=A0A841DFQ2_9ACTN|nr:MFS transporter [Kribbella solani]MBB5977342.1 MFS family permease [Kribbella solani]